jgi:hypothetical protein
MTIAAVLDELDRMSVEEIDQAIAHHNDAIKRLQRLRRVVQTAGPRTPRKSPTGEAMTNKERIAQYLRIAGAASLEGISADTKINKGSISSVLSRHRDLFEPVPGKAGHYRLRQTKDD